MKYQRLSEVHTFKYGTNKGFVPESVKSKGIGSFVIIMVVIATISVAAVITQVI